MSEQDPMPDESADLLEQLEAAKNEAIERCHHRTASQLAIEIKRKAKECRRIGPYAWALHTLANQSTSLFEYERGADSSIELIAVLESEDRARLIQPDLDMAEYDELVSRLSSCAYDILGRITALSRGYNSEGVHDAVAEGIQVCRRTGKVECINCFREYAGQVFLAADDVEMALHHMRQVATRGEERRWAGAQLEAEALLLAGRLDDALAAARRAWEFADSYHSPNNARLFTALLQESISLLKGEKPTGDSSALGRIGPEHIPPAGESLEYQLVRDLVDALRSCLAGEAASAVKLLTDWDRRLNERRSLYYWFEVRLRLIAAYRLMSDEKRVKALATALEAKAHEARDWLTLRRLALLLDRKVPVSPIAPANPLCRGESTAAPEEDEPENESALPALTEPEFTPLGDAIGAIGAKLDAAADPDGPVRLNEILDSLLALGQEKAVHPADVAVMLELARQAGGDPSRGPAIWEWAEAIAAPFAGDAAVLNQLAVLGDSLRTMDGALLDDRISTNRLDSLFKSSLDLDSDNLENFGRAAVYYHNQGRLNEAERCLARVLRLDRSHSWAAHWLAEIYRDSDRAHDALAVLDLALRAGSQSPELAWDATLLAHSLGQYEASLTYVDQFERAAPGRPWTNYYRASALLWLGRNALARGALDEEERRSREGALHITILRACASSASGQSDDFKRLLKSVLEVRLSLVTDLSHSGLVSLFERLWDSAAVLGDDDPLRIALVERLLASGLAPNSLFDSARFKAPKADGLSFYVCTLIQPLDEHWRNSAGCLSGEDDWPAYRINWGVLAPSEAEAGDRVFRWQARCYPLAATIEEIKLEDEGFCDHPGVVWQGLRSPDGAADSP
jgi:tetratricopeptide (TPR) repeat protein